MPLIVGYLIALLGFSVLYIVPDLVGVDHVMEAKARCRCISIGIGVLAYPIEATK